MKTILFAILLAASPGFFTENPEKARTIEQHFPVQASQKIELQGFSGSDIRIQSWDKNEVFVKLNITFSSSFQDDEQRYLDGIALKEDKSADHFGLTLYEPKTTSRSNSSFWSWVSSFFRGTSTRKTIEGEIFVPRSNPLHAGISYGSVSLEGMSGYVSVRGTSNSVTLKNCSSISEIVNDYGKVTIVRCGGDLQLTCKSGTINVVQFKGKADLDADYSQIKVQDITQSLRIMSTSATMTIERVGGDAVIHSDYSTITANNIAGFLEILDKSGRIQVKGVDGIKIEGDYSVMEISDVSGKSSREMSLRGQSGNIALSNAVGRVKIDNPYGGIDLRNIRGNVELDSKSARVKADDVVGDWHSDAEYSDMDITRLSAKQVTMTNKSGKISVEFKVVPTIVEIHNEYADVIVKLPEGFNGDIDLTATYGTVDTNIPLQKRKSFDGSGAFGMRTGTNRSSKLEIDTKSGNISVEQR